VKSKCCTNKNATNCGRKFRGTHRAGETRHTDKRWKEYAEALSC
jgi:hypothetical protein